MERLRSTSVELRRFAPAMMLKYALLCPLSEAKRN